MATKSFTKFPSLNSLVVCVIALLILLFLQLLQSCKKDSVPERDTAYLSIINTSPTLATYNFYLNQGRVNSGALPFGATIPYMQINTGEYSAKLTTGSSTESLLTKSLTFEKDKVYSLFFIDKASNLDYLLINDEIENPATENAFVRFINVSPDAGNLDLVFKDSTALVTDKPYKASSEFIEIPAKTYTFEIKDKTSGEVKATLTNAQIKTGEIYTIIARGLITPTDTDQPFSGQLINN